jgi:hypothetical protein
MRNEIEDRAKLRQRITILETKYSALLRSHPLMDPGLGFDLGAMEKEQCNEIKALGKQETVYVTHYKDGSRATVVVLWDHGAGTDISSQMEIVRGAAVCVPKDEYVKIIGRIVARGRALRAAKTGRPKGEMNRTEEERLRRRRLTTLDRIPPRTLQPAACDALMWLRTIGRYKSECRANPTNTELELIQKQHDALMKAKEKGKDDLLEGREAPSSPLEG